MSGYSHTIAIARDLVAAGRYAQAAELLGSLPVSGRDADPDDTAMVRALAARAVLLDASDAESALGWLESYRTLEMRNTLGYRARCEVCCWLGRALTEQRLTADVNAEMILCLFAEALLFGRPDQQPDVGLWTSIGRARLFERLGHDRLAAHYRDRSHAAGHQARSSDSHVAARIGPSAMKGVIAPDGPSGPTEHEGTWDGADALLDRLGLYLDAAYPVVLVGERGAGKEYAARRLHARRAGPVRGTENAPYVVESYLLPSTSNDDPYPENVPPEDDRPSSEHETVVLKDLHQVPADRLARVPPYVRRLIENRYRVVITWVPSEAPAPDELPDELYVLLQAFSFEIPPLRTRRREMASLVRSVAAELADDGHARLAFTDAAIEVLAGYDWPDNMDELVSLIEELQQSAAVDPLRVVDAADLKLLRLRRNGTTRDTSLHVVTEGKDLSHMLEGVERDLIEQALDEAGGHVTAAARALGLSRQGLYKKMKRLDIDPHRLTRADGLQ